jgi:hypothetical protein
MTNRNQEPHKIILSLEFQRRTLQDSHLGLCLFVIHANADSTAERACLPQLCLGQCQVPVNHNNFPSLSGEENEKGMEN